MSHQIHLRRLVLDGALMLQVEPGLAPLVERWLPVPPVASPVGSVSNAAVIVVQAAPRPGRDQSVRSDKPTLSVGSARAWVDPVAEVVEVVGDDRAFGHIDLAERRATLSPAQHADQTGAWSMYYMLTIAAALLLGRIGRALAHAGAVVPPGEDAWLVVGDARAGKTTTCVNLIAAGWGYLSDDQVILAPAAVDGVDVEGWLRRFHLDRRWQVGESSGDRDDFDPDTLRAGARANRASLGGLLVTRVHADRPTRLGRLSEADALAAVIRQSPWLLADSGPASALLAWLSRITALPRYSLSLGMDTYRNGGRLIDLLATARRRTG